MVMVNNENVNNNDVGYVNNGERGATGNVRIPGPLKPVDDSKITTFTGDVYDDNFQKNQREINKQFGNAIQQLGNVEDSATDVPYYRDGNYTSDINYPSSYKRAVNTIIIPTTDFNKYYNNTTNNYLPLNNGTLAIPDSVVDDGITLKVREGDIISFKLFNAIDIQYNVIFDYSETQGNMTRVFSDLVDPRNEESDEGLDLQHGRSSTPLFSIVPQGAKYLKIHFTLLDLPTEDIVVQVGGCGISRLITAIAKDRYTSGDSLFDIFNFTRVDNAGRTWQVGNEPETVTKTVSSSFTEVTVRYQADLFKKNRIYHVEVKNGSGEKAKVVDINHVSVSVLKQTGENTYGTIATIDNIDNTAFFIYDDNKREIETTYNSTELTSQGRTTDTYFDITFFINNSSYVNEDIINLSICEASVEDKFIHLFKQIAYIHDRIDHINSGSESGIQLRNESIGWDSINTSNIVSTRTALFSADVNPSDKCDYKLLIQNESNCFPEIQVSIYDANGTKIGGFYPTYPGYKLGNSGIAYFTLQNFSQAAHIEIEAQVGTPNTGEIKHGLLRISCYKIGVLDSLLELYKQVTDDDDINYVSGNRTITEGTKSGIITWDTAVKTLSPNDILQVILSDDAMPGANSGVGNISFTLSLYGGNTSSVGGPAIDVIKTYNGTNNSLFVSGVTASNGLRGRISFQVENDFTGSANIVVYVKVLSNHAAIAALLSKMLTLPTTTQVISGGGSVASLSSGNLKVLNAATDTLQQDASDANTTYEIRDDITLDGTWTVPANVSLFFNGGSISGGTINFNNTYVYGKPKFINNNYTGELANTEVYFGWFSPSTALTYDNSGLLTKAISVSKETLFIETMYPLANTVTISKRISLKGVSSKAILYANRTSNAKQGFRMTACKSAFTTGSGASLSMFGLSIVGIKDLYTGGNMRVTSGSQGTFTDTDQFGNSYSIAVTAPEGGISIAGIEMPLTGYINTIQDCAICGFTYGIKTMGGGIDKMIDNYFSACRWGVHFSGYTSDMMITNNKFNTCGNDVNYKSINLSGTATDISNNPEYLKEVAGGLYLRGTGMVQLDHNRFEFNFIQIVLDEANIACQIQDNMFDKATCTHILVYNGNDTAFLSQNPDHRERFQPAFSGILIDGNSFLRGANIQSNAGSASFASVAGESIFYIKNSTESQSSGFTEAAGYSENRGCILTINNNVITDFIEVDTSINSTNIHYPSCIFKIANGGDGGLIINSTGNDFTNSTATNIVNFVYGSSGKVYFNDNGSNFGNLSHAMWNDILVLNKFEIDGSKLIIYNSQSDGETVSQDYVIDLSDYTLTPGSGGGSSSTPTNVYTKTEVDTLLNQLSVNSGANPFATGNVIVVSGSESNLTSLLSTQNKTFFIKGNIDLDNTDFTFAANSKYIFLNSAVNNALEVYLGNNTVVQGAKFNGFKSIVLGVNSVLRDCDCDGQNASMGIYFNGNGGKVIYNKIHGIRNTFGDYTAAVRSHRTGRGSFNYLENLECSHNMFYDVTPKASGTTKLCVIYVNEVTINIDNNLILGIHDADGTVGGQHDLDLIHIGTDMQYNDNSNDTYALPYGWQTTPNGALTTGVDSGFCSVMSTICNNTFRGIGYIKSVVKLQARDVLVSGNSITFDDANGEWYSVFRLLRADHTLVSNNSVYYNCNKTNCRMIECSQSSDVTITGNSFMYARVGLDDIRDNTNYSQPSWRSYDIVLQTCTNLVFSNNHIYTNNRNSLPSWQCCHGLLFKDNYFHFTDPYCEASYTVVGTYLSTGVITHNPATVNSDVTFDGNVFYIEAFKRSYTSANIAVFSFATDKYLTFVNNHIKAPCSVQFNVFRVTGAEYTFKDNVIDGDKTIFNTHNTYGNIAASTTDETSAALNIEGMKVDTINVKQITSINLKNCKLVNSSTPIVISSVTNFNSIDTDFTKVTASYFMKLEGGSVTGVVNGLGDVTAVQNTGTGTLGVVFKNARTNGTTTQRPANVNVGYIYFDSTVGYHVYWSGSEWLPLTTTSSGGGSSSGTGEDTPSGGGGGGSSSEGGGSSSESGGSTEGGGSSSSGTQTVEGQDRLAIAESSTPAWAAPDATVETDAILDEGCYVIDEANGKMAKLKTDDHTKFADGTSWDGTYGNAFRHIPAFYYKVDNGNLIISRTAITGGKSIPEMWIGCYQGYIDSNDALRSIPGVVTTGNKTCTEFYTAAQENGSDYGVMSYQAQQAIVFLYLMKYHNTNSTNTFVGDNDIHRFTGYATFTTGSTASLGDGTGNVSYDSSRTISALFGIEALISSRLEFRQNIYLDQTNNVAIIWDDNVAVPDQNTTTRSVSNPLANGDYIQELTWGEYGDIIPKTAQTGASASTYKNQYYCDAGYPKDGDVVVQGGLPAVTDAGGLFFFGSDPSTTKGSNYGARLCMYGASSATLVTGAELASENA